MTVFFSAVKKFIFYKNINDHKEAMMLMFKGKGEEEEEGEEKVKIQTKSQEEGRRKSKNFHIVARFV